MTLGAPPLQNRRILLIDDNRAIHGDFRKILCPEETVIDSAEAAFFEEPVESAPGCLPRFEVESAYQGEEAVILLRQAEEEGRPYGIAFIDVRMPPGIDGIETAEQLWKISPELEVVICTAYSDYSWPQMCSRLGHRERLLVLKKPFAAIEVLQMACGLSEKWSLGQQARQRLCETELAVEKRTLELREANRQLGAEIEQRRQAEHHLLRAQRLESVGTLASGMAHDLNNTISPILMAAQLLRDELPPEVHAQMVETIESSAERAAGIVKQVLAFARGTEGEQALLEPQYLVREIEKISTSTFSRSISVRSRVAENLPLIRGDRTLLQQVLLNLCLNARDAMKKGGNLLIEADEVEMDAVMASGNPSARPGHYVRIRVADTGIGIPAESLARIFDPFYTTKELAQGTGLGLSMVAGIIKGHDGFYDVQSEQGFGTVFSIFLPSMVRDDAVVPVPREPGAVEAGHGEIILVVDDEEAIREATAAMLSRNGYRVLTAANGAEGLSTFARDGTRIDLVVSDILMPVLDGIELFKGIRKMSPKMPLIASSGYADERRVGELETLRLQGVLSKPFRSEVLLGTIRKVLKRL